MSWINFKEVKETISFETVLRHYGVEIKAKGEQHQGFCPLPNHSGVGKSPSFSANLKRGIFQCFGCGATGNLLDFAALMEKINPRDGKAVRVIAAKLLEQYGKGSRPTEPPETQKAIRDDQRAEIIVNAPLDFELKNLNPGHPYLFERGFSEETIEKFGLGYCSRGYLKERIAIPLHDNEGKLIGYAGRLVNDNLVDPDHPKYLLPSTRERGDQRFEFQKSQFLYNGHRIASPVNDLVIVEGFPSVWWLAQHGFNNVVALMGASCSEKQAELVISKIEPTGCAWLFPDGNEAGERCVGELLGRLSPFRSCRWVRLENDKQPTDLACAELVRILPEQKTSVVSAKRSSRSIKARLMAREISERQAIIEFAISFPSLRSLEIERKVWNPERLDSICSKLSPGERAAALLVLHVWNPHHTWHSGKFDIGAVDVWDEEHRKAFITWASDPWWC